MARNLIQKIILGIEMIFLFILLTLLFEFIIQPILINIDPMFADQDLPIGKATGRGPETPAEVAGYATILIGCVMYYLVKGEIKDYIFKR